MLFLYVEGTRVLLERERALPFLRALVRAWAMGGGVVPPPPTPQTPDSED